MRATSQAELVARLRESKTQCRALDRSALLEEAAAEIERMSRSIESGLRTLEDLMDKLSEAREKITTLEHRLARRR